ncbi:hypothetical protein DY000_02042450 [Brassica cretica]|uniref:RING-type E3 ubiquitin transferase n=1 Tax=Brassica cretica TaxID=69181 RepID=A0ABQ7B8H0_BRACR|nr:hypothetical protein DY000_02042450 [Brassica cretica]
MEDMLTYHDIPHPNSTYLIEETRQYVMNEARASINTLANDLQVTVTIKDYNPNGTSRLDVDLIITDLEDTNRPPTTEEENEMCIVCFGNYNQHNYLCTLTCGHSFHFTCIDQWLRRNISCPICRERKSPIFSTQTTISKGLTTTISKEVTKPSRTILKPTSLLIFKEALLKLKLQIQVWILCSSNSWNFKPEMRRP